MRPNDHSLASQLDASLRAFELRVRSLPGIQSSVNRDSLLEQFVESIRRVKYVGVIRTRALSDDRGNPSSDLFDPLKAAILHQRRGEIDEAFWLVFLFVHFGKHRSTAWRLARDVYGGLGSGPWTWARVSARPNDFRQWLATQQARLKGSDGIARRFGNHRKYQSLDALSPNGTGAAFESYVAWVRPPRNHETLVCDALTAADGDPRKAFDLLYRSMSGVASFGRTARFDYLTMVGKLELAAIEPGSTYMQGATGPRDGARLLFGGDTMASFRGFELESWLVELGDTLGVGMQVMEDALCNWQKSPGRFLPFRG